MGGFPEKLDLFMCKCTYTCTCGHPRVDSPLKGLESLDVLVFIYCNLGSSTSLSHCPIFHHTSN